MISTLLINEELKQLKSLEQTITLNCPQIQICGFASTLPEVFHLIEEKRPHLIFIEKGNCNAACIEILKELSSIDLETILIADEKDFAFEAIHFQIGSYLLKPLNNQEIIKAVKKASNQIQLKKSLGDKQLLINRMMHQLPNSELVGIPTIEGFEFLVIGDIIRCEGLQKCTRIITKDQSDIISSYNIGEFRKKLEPYGFFSPHKSHLINMGKVKKFHREGTITLSNGSAIPVARRRKQEFLDRLSHL